MENLGKQTETADIRITNRIQEIEERISATEAMIEEIVTLVKENVKN